MTLGLSMDLKTQRFLDNHHRRHQVDWCAEIYSSNEGAEAQLIQTFSCCVNTLSLPDGGYDEKHGKSLWLDKYLTWLVH